MGSMSIADGNREAPDLVMGIPLRRRRTPGCVPSGGVSRGACSAWVTTREEATV